MPKCKDCEYWMSEDPENVSVLGDCHGPVPESVQIKLKKKMQGYEGSGCEAFVKKTE